MAYRGDEEVRVAARVGRDLGPGAFVDGDVLEAPGDLPHVGGVAREPAPIGPGPAQAPAGVAEDGHEASVELDPRALLGQEVVDADLADVGPHAEQVGEVQDGEQRADLVG